MEQTVNLAPAPPVIALHIVLCLHSHCVGDSPTQKNSLNLIGGESISYPRIHFLVQFIITICTRFM